MVIFEKKDAGGTINPNAATKTVGLALRLCVCVSV
jgi:hypothetical protein